MKSTYAMLARVPLFKLYRLTGWPQMLPMNLTLSPSPKCNSRCLTCNIWMKREDELSLQEWDKVLASLGKAPYWFTISGGEPLMYPHIVELAQLAYKHCRPAVINIPTNGILSSIPDRVEQIAKSCPESQLIINLSLDGVGDKHDRIRGIAGNFDRFEKRLKTLLELRQRLRNLTVGIHSVISTFNHSDIAQIIEYADRSSADQFITEIAEPRVELDTVGLPITPKAADYGKAIDQVVAYINRKSFTGIARFTEALRIEYYKLVKRILDEKDQVIACYAGWVSAQIYSDGTVWPCCVRADKLGNLREHDYDFKSIWFGEPIKEARRSIAAKECHCTLANASYTNLLHHVPTLARLTFGLLASKPKGREAGDVKDRPRPVSTAPDPVAADADAGASVRLAEPPPAPMFEWLDKFHHSIEKDQNYAEKALASYALGIKGKGALAGVVAELGPDCCDAATQLPPGRVYAPKDAPRLPLPACTHPRCDCVYRPAMSYEQVDER
jgi:MoaA/NifB/PqqE/SkfB family radical SAM enzyme